MREEKMEWMYNCYGGDSMEADGGCTPQSVEAEEAVRTVERIL